VTTPLQRFLAQLATNADTLIAFQKHPDDLMDKAGLSPEERAAIKGHKAEDLEARLACPDSPPGPQTGGIPVTIVVVPGYPQAACAPYSMPPQGGGMPAGIVVVNMPCAPASPYPCGQNPVTDPNSPSHTVTWVTPHGPVTWAVPQGPVTWAVPQGPVTWAPAHGPVTWAPPHGPVTWAPIGHTATWAVMQNSGAAAKPLGGAWLPASNPAVPLAPRGPVTWTVRPVQR
jgi:hypothetical protein